MVCFFFIKFSWIWVNNWLMSLSVNELISVFTGIFNKGFYSNTKLWMFLIFYFQRFNLLIDCTVLMRLISILEIFFSQMCWIFQSHTIAAVFKSHNKSFSKMKLNDSSIYCCANAQPKCLTSCLLVGLMPFYKLLFF